MKTLLFLGRQPQLGLAELESLYGSDAIALLTDQVVASELAPDQIDFARLGGSFKLSEVLATIGTTDWKAIEKELIKLVPTLTTPLPEGKLILGVSVYELAIKNLDITATALRIKKAIRAKSGHNSRTVPNTAASLSSAQILHNKLTGERGIEMVVLKVNDQVIISRTIAEQDINAYASRDQNRPKRDARVGMLPPKLAQIIINLAIDKNTPPTAILDPFCGTGVLLQEAALMGYDIYGTDIEPRMIDYSEQNLLWLNETHTLPKVAATLEVGDATNYAWKEPFSAVAAEGYLGQPFTGFPTPDKLNTVTNTCNLIAKEFFKNLADQVPSGTRICIGLPAWQRADGSFVHLKILDSLEDLGYNRVSFVHTSTEELLYYRPDQVVARELLVIIRK